MAFIDDISMNSKVWEKNHGKTPDDSFTTLERAPTFVKFNKCEFDWKEITFLGYTISKEGIVINSTIVEVV